MKIKRTWLGWPCLVALLLATGIVHTTADLRAQEKKNKSPRLPMESLVPPPLAPVPEILIPDSAPTPKPTLPHLDEPQLRAPSTPEFRLPNQPISAPAVKQVAARQPAMLSDLDSSQLLRQWSGPLDVFISKSELEQNKPWQSGVHWIGMQELGGKRFLMLQSMQAQEETWLLESSQIIAIRQKK